MITCPHCNATMEFEAPTVHDDDGAVCPECRVYVPDDEWIQDDGLSDAAFLSFYQQVE